MARKQREPAEVVKQRIEETAIRLFAERDPDAVSLSHIGAELGTSAQAIYYHYGSKAALRQAALARLVERIIEGLRVLSGDAPALTLTALTERAIQLALDYPVEFRATLVELVRDPAEIRAHLTPHLQVRFERASALLREGQARGIVRPGLDPEHFIPTAAMLVLCVLNLPSGVLPLALETEEGQRAVARLRDALRMVLVGLFVDPEPYLV